jgi:hypothetical protein
LTRGRSPATVLNYLSHLSSIFAIAKPARGIDLDRLLRLFENKYVHRPKSIPMHKVVGFALFLPGGKMKLRESGAPMTRQ